MPDPLESARRSWGLVAGAVALAAAGLAVLTALRPGMPPAASWAGAVFYGNALVNLAALVVALASQQRLLREVRAVAGREGAGRVVRARGAVALAALQAGALVAVTAAYLTGEWVNLAFLVPFFGFVAAFFPADARVAAWRRGPASG